MEINKNWVKKNPFIKFSERFLKKNNLWINKFNKLK